MTKDSKKSDDAASGVCASHPTEGNTPLPLKLADPGTQVPAGPGGAR
jgi:hypothetical protein